MGVPATPIAARLLARREITPAGCWVWTGAIAANGYGQIRIGSKTDGTMRTALVHRVSFEVHKGPVPEGSELDHLCRVRACFNPDHLEPVSRRENTMRGLAPAMVGALNGAKSTCKSGHPFDESNTYMRPGGGRSCRTCLRQRRRTRGPT